MAIPIKSSIKKNYLDVLNEKQTNNQVMTPINKPKINLFDFSQTNNQTIGVGALNIQKPLINEPKKQFDTSSIQETIINGHPIDKDMVSRFIEHGKKIGKTKEEIYTAYQKGLNQGVFNKKQEQVGEPDFIQTQQQQKSGFDKLGFATGLLFPGVGQLSQGINNIKQNGTFEKISNLGKNLRFNYSNELIKSENPIVSSFGNLVQSLKFAGNIPGGIIKVIGGFGEAIIKSNETAKSLKTLSESIVETGLNKLTGQDHYTTEEKRLVAQGLEKSIKDNFGSLEAVRKTITENPVDFLMTIQGGLGLAKGFTNNVNTIAKIDKVNEIINPVNMLKTEYLAGKKIITPFTPSKILKKSGEEIYNMAIKPNVSEAELILKNKAGLINKPVTRADTALKLGLTGTETGLGVKALKKADEIFKKTIGPALDNSKETHNINNILEKVKNKIINSKDAELRKKDLLDGFNALKEDYSFIDKKDYSTRDLQTEKSSLDKFTPTKIFKGNDVANGYNQVKNILANVIREQVRDDLGKAGVPNAKELYRDYSNLIELSKIGIKGLTEGGLKGGFGTFWSTIYDKVATPIKTIGGKVLYRTGEGLEFIGPKGIKKIGDYLNINKIKIENGNIINNNIKNDNNLTGINSISNNSVSGYNNFVIKPKTKKLLPTKGETTKTPIITPQTIFGGANNDLPIIPNNVITLKSGKKLYPNKNNIIQESPAIPKKELLSRISKEEVVKPKKDVLPPKKEQPKTPLLKKEAQDTADFTKRKGDINDGVADLRKHLPMRNIRYGDLDINGVAIKEGDIVRIKMGKDTYSKPFEFENNKSMGGYEVVGNKNDTTNTKKSNKVFDNKGINDIDNQIWDIKDRLSGLRLKERTVGREIPEIRTLENQIESLKIKKEELIKGQSFTPKGLNADTKFTGEELNSPAPGVSYISKEGDVYIPLKKSGDDIISYNKTKGEYEIIPNPDSINGFKFYKGNKPQDYVIRNSDYNNMTLGETINTFENTKSIRSNLESLNKSNIDEIATKISTTHFEKIKEVITKYIKEYGENIKNYLSQLADDIADIVGGKTNLFGGERAKLFDKSRRTEAINFEKAGKSKDYIWQKTGWEKGKDGEWRFEIDDSNAKLIKTEGEGKLSDFIDHPQLFKQYPEIKDIKIQFQNNIGNDGAYYNSINKTIVLDNNLPKEKIKQYILHELQHDIQFKEGFDTGFNPKNNKDYKRLFREVEARAVEKRMDYNKEKRSKILPSKSYDIKDSSKLLFNTYDGKSPVIIGKGSKQVSKVSDELKPLIEEAKKSKSATEFVKGLEDKGEIFYHGTTKKFGEFDDNFIGRGSGNEGFFGKGHYFTDDKNLANWYSKGTNIVVSAFLNFKKPFKWADINNRIKYKNILEELGLTTKDWSWSKENGLSSIEYNKKVQDALKKNGYDGIIVKRNLPEGISDYSNLYGTRHYGNEYLVFDPKNIITEAQLKQIYEQANKLKLLPKKTK